MNPTRLVAARALRGFADGFVSVLLAVYLSALGLSPFEIGALVTATLLGSALLTLAVGLVSDRLEPRSVLLASSGLMLATGVGFAGFTGFWPLLVVALAGTLNPSASDVSVFLPVEQAALANAVPGARRTALFARYNVAGALLGALGAGLSGAPDLLARAFGIEPLAALRAGFLLYAAVALAIAALYLRIPRGLRAPRAGGGPLARSRRTVLGLTALFSLDSFGGGFVVQSLLVLWLVQRFALEPAALGAVFLGAGLLSAASQLASSPIAARIGLIRTMVYTHLPANVCLLLAAFAPSASGAIALLLSRAALSQMDVPARQAYVMAAVPPEERAAAASVTNVPRSLASALAPLLAGALLARTSFGWPLVAAALLKITYDLSLLALFARRPEPEG